LRINQLYFNVAVNLAEVDKTEEFKNWYVKNKDRFKGPLLDFPFNE
jgi:hypothetical protein